MWHQLNWTLDDPLQSGSFTWLAIWFGAKGRLRGWGFSSSLYGSPLVSLSRGFLLASSYQGVWIYRKSVPREEGRRTRNFYNIDLEVIQPYFCCVPWTNQSQSSAWVQGEGIEILSLDGRVVNVVINEEWGMDPMVVFILGKYNLLWDLSWFFSSYITQILWTLLDHTSPTLICSGLLLTCISALIISYRQHFFSACNQAFINGAP